MFLTGEKAVSAMFNFVKIRYLQTTNLILKEESIHSNFRTFLQEYHIRNEDFPLTFKRGSSEGFWWAFISVTTVG